MQRISMQTIAAHTNELAQHPPNLKEWRKKILPRFARTSAYDLQRVLTHIPLWQVELGSWKLLVYVMKTVERRLFKGCLAGGKLTVEAIQPFVAEVVQKNWTESFKSRSSSHGGSGQRGGREANGQRPCPFFQRETGCKVKGNSCPQGGHTCAKCGSNAHGSHAGK